MNIHQMIQDLKNVFLKPDETIRELAKRQTKDGLYYLGFYFITLFIFSFIIAYAFEVYLNKSNASLLFLFMGIISAAIFRSIYSFIFFIFYQAIIFGVAKVLNGKGSFWQQIFVMLIIASGFYIVGIIAVFILIISALIFTSVGLSILLFIEMILGILIGIVLVIYLLYLSIVTLKEVHGFSTLRAIANFVIALIIALIIYIALFIALFLLLRWL